jgi:hypothetical protein
MADRSEWPYRALVLVWVISLLLAALELPSLDGPAANSFRLGVYAAVSAIYWVRIGIARLRHERSRGYCFYIALVLLIPFLIWPLQDWLEGFALAGPTPGQGG